MESLKAHTTKTLTYHPTQYTTPRPHNPNKKVADPAPRPNSMDDMAVGKALELLVQSPFPPSSPYPASSPGGGGGGSTSLLSLFKGGGGSGAGKGSGGGGGQ